MARLASCVGRYLSPRPRAWRTARASPSRACGTETLSTGEVRSVLSGRAMSPGRERQVIPPNRITGAKAGGPRQAVAMRTHWASPRRSFLPLAGTMKRQLIAILACVSPAFCFVASQLAESADESEFARQFHGEWGKCAPDYYPQPGVTIWPRDDRSPGSESSATSAGDHAADSAPRAPHPGYPRRREREARRAPSRGGTGPRRIRKGARPDRRGRRRDN